ncbi:MAG: cell division protein SepF [Clostridia bacterium]|nr:cell division protein SepF [Clostridia bacterium]
MSIWDNIKNIMTIPDEDEFEDEMEETVQEHKEENEYTAKKPESTPRIIKSKNANYNPDKAQMQVVLVKPDRFEDVEAIADHLNNKKTVVLNLEDANREVSRRIIDFLSGVAYANHGNIRKVANSTFIIVARDVDIMGELMLDDLTESKLYF